jgi:hypothetical protein
MVWAFTYDTPNTYVNSAYNTPKPTQNTVDEIVKLTSLREKGSITEVEYQKAKDKILNS